MGGREGGRNLSRCEVMTVFQAFSIHKDNLTVALLIPSIKVPLNPTECMCSSIQNAANVTRHPLPGGTHPCSPDTRCGGMYCNITFVNIATHTTIDPCTESVQITTDRFDRTFTNSEELPISGGATVYVTIHHYNYSMEVSVSRDHGGVPLRGDINLE